MFGRWANIIAGIWLVIGRWVLGFHEGTSRANDLWVGLAVIAVALTAIRVPGFRFVNTGLGAWLVIAPFILSYTQYASVVNDVIVGLLVLVFSLVPQVRLKDLRHRHALAAS